MRISSFTLAMLTATIKAQDAVTHSEDLKCGKCIKAGFNFCHTGTDGEAVAAGDAEPTAKCCADDQCAEASDETYTCSLTYSDTTYALQMCPQKQAQCGETQEVAFTEVDEPEVVLEVTGLTEGESCTYKIKSSKGSPCFKVKDESTITDETVEITYIEFEGDRVEKTDAPGTSAEDSPEEGLPTRDQSFEDSGNQGEKGGQKKPPRRKGDGSKTDGEDVDEEKEYLDEKKTKEELTDEEKAEKEDGGWFKKEKDGEGETEEGVKPRPEEGETMEETDAVEGYGQPTKGTYSTGDKGYKTFGTTGQGENKEGAKEDDASEEKDRTVIISVTANFDQGDETILLETGNYEFLEEYTWEETSAKYLTFAGVVGLIGASMI